MTHEIWTIEERCWTAGLDHYAKVLDPECVMAFPAPAGIIAGARIRESLQGAPRWAAVSMQQRHLDQASPDIIVIGYLATGERPGAPPYRAYCTSSYRLAGTAWRLIQHQQTPV